MTKLFTLLISLTALGFLSFSMVDPKPASGPGGITIPDSVNAVIQKACVGCHSDDGSALARGKLNFSQWNSMDNEKQVKKAVASCLELKKGNMPPKKWRANNAAKVPTQAEIDMVCKWAASLQK